MTVNYKKYSIGRDWLLRRLRKSAPLNAFPCRSPRGNHETKTPPFAKGRGMGRECEYHWERIGYFADLKSLLRLTPFRVARRGAVTKQKQNKKQLRSLLLFLHLRLKVNFSRRYKNKKRCRKTSSCFVFVSWELTDSNRRPSACKADALNQLS